jgi:hypothetical protein
LWETALPLLLLFLLSFPKGICVALAVAFPLRPLRNLCDLCGKRPCRCFSSATFAQPLRPLRETPLHSRIEPRHHFIYHQPITAGDAPT